MFMFLFLSLVAIAAGSVSKSQLDYNHQNNWGGVCKKGRAQSPINVPAPSSKVMVPRSTSFLDLPRKFFNMTNENNLNTVKYDVSPAGSVARVPWLGNRHVTLVQLHLHWGATDNRGSEHLIGGETFAAEAHLVTSYIASDLSKKYMVFARVFQLGETNPMIDQMIAEETKEGSKRNIGQFDLSDLYPADTDKWLTYDGGLTTPPCSEIVDWVIVSKPLSISSVQLNKLRTMRLGNGRTPAMKRNWRNTQALNGRQSTEYCRRQPVFFDFDFEAVIIQIFGN